MEMVVPANVEGLLHHTNIAELTIGHVVAAGSGCGATGIDLEVDRVRQCEGLLACRQNVLRRR